MTAERAAQPKRADASCRKRIDPSDVEDAIYERWLAADVFAPDGRGSTADPDAEPFTIIQPPPNVTGSLHLGHAQRAAVEDLMVRHARMTGRPTLFLPGLDHASIAAQFVLDGILAGEGESRQTLGRERYLERMRRFIAETREMMLGQQRRLGASVDWGRLRFTMDEGSAKAVRVAFKTLVRSRPRVPDRGARQLVPGLPDQRQRSRGDLDARDRNALVDPLPPDRRGDRRARPRPRRSPSRRPGPRRSSATPRSPCTPTTRATRALVGRRVRIPFVERDVPIIADEVVDPAFGTGAVKITPAHDHDDHETGLRHGLPMPTILDDAAAITSTGTPLDGLDRYEARAAILAGLAARGDLAGEQAHEMVIGRCQRSDDVIEPRLKTQWFVRTAPLAAAALEATRSGRTPDRARALREDLGALAHEHPRLERLPPAVVGAPDPGVVLPDGHVTVSADEAGPAACEVCGRPADQLQQDPDIFDTWFSSGLWPFSTLGWPDDTRRPAALLPDVGHGDRLRHHLLLGRPDDDARHRS